jgi:hypothetical protein
MKSHELELIRERLKTTRHHQLAQEVEEMQVWFLLVFYIPIYFFKFEECKELFLIIFLQVQNVELENGLKEAKLLQSQGDNKMKELEYKIKNAKALKEKELKVMRFLNQGY